MMDKKATDAEIKMRYQYSVKVLKTCADAPDQAKAAHWYEKRISLLKAKADIEVEK